MRWQYGKMKEASKGLSNITRCLTKGRARLNPNGKLSLIDTEPWDSVKGKEHKNDPRPGMG